MEALDTEIILLAAVLFVAVVTIPIVVISIHQRKRRRYERAAGIRRKEKIRL